MSFHAPLVDRLREWELLRGALDVYKRQVLIYAQRGSGRRAGLYTDYTFALWNGDERGAGELVPFAKAYSGLTDAEIAEVDRFVRANTEDRFGPVRAVRPELVMEIAFESIQASGRHKSGAVSYTHLDVYKRQS